MLRPFRRLSLLVLSAVAMVSAASDPAYASAWDLYGFGARGAALAGAVTADARGGTATYYNPAALLIDATPTLHLGADMVLPALHVEFDRPPGPEALAPNDVGTDFGLHVGLSMPLPGWFERRVALGLGVHHPLDGGTRIEAFDPQRPQFFLYQSLPDKLLLAPALAVAISDWLLVGVGLQVLAFIEGSADTAVSLGGRRFTKTGLRVDILANNAPTAGVVVRPGGPDGALRLGLTYRHGLDFRYQLPLALDIEEVGTLRMEIEGVALYTPAQADAGVAWQISPDLLLLGAVTWAGWSHSPDPAAEVIVDLQGEHVDRQTLAHATSVPVDLGARDILIPRLGAEWQANERWILRAGLAVRPTPLPTPTGRTNYIDAPTVTTAFGATWSDWLDLAAHTSWMLPRRVDKRSEADPVGAYTAGGPVLRLTAGIRRSL